MKLPVRPPFAPMEALLAHKIPTGPNWQYEPKWDGFRCLAFRDGDEVKLQSKSGQDLTRYFPELVEAFLEVRSRRFVLDGEIGVPIGGHFSFDDLLQRIHPAASRVRKLARENPALFVAFDLLVDEKGESLLSHPLNERRRRLEKFMREWIGKQNQIRLSPATTELKLAKRWFEKAGGIWMGLSPNAPICLTCPGNGPGCKR